MPYSKEYYAKHKEKILEESRMYYTQHKERILERLKGYRSTTERKQYMIQYRIDHPELKREYYERPKEIVLDHYGHKCQWEEGCDVIDSDMLQVDHINGGGNQHRRQIKTDIYSWLINNNFPLGYRLLCANHNCKHRANLGKAKREKNVVQ